MKIEPKNLNGRKSPAHIVLTVLVIIVPLHQWWQASIRRGPGLLTWQHQSFTQATGDHFENCALSDTPSSHPSTQLSNFLSRKVDLLIFLNFLLLIPKGFKISNWIPFLHMCQNCEIAQEPQLCVQNGNLLLMGKKSALKLSFTSFLSQTLSIPTFNFDYQTNFFYYTKIVFGIKFDK